MSIDTKSIREESELPRYFMRWRDNQPVPEASPVGYWTPWHIAEEAVKQERSRSDLLIERHRAGIQEREIDALRAENEALKREREEAHKRATALAIENGRLAQRLADLDATNATAPQEDEPK